jgi:ElaB/YqjD/DUF883 family membrane-anchored ribosome-binding protein
MKIKTKDIIKGTIKTIDKGAIATERTKDTIVNIKEKAENAYSSENETYDYASDKVTYVANRSTDEIVNTFNNQGKKSVETTKNNIIKTKQKIKDFKIKQTQKKDIKTKLEKAGKSIKIGSKQVIKTQKEVIKSTEKVAKETVKASQRAKQVAVQTAKTTVKTTKAAAKATVSAIKEIIAATEALVSAIIAGGWVAVIVVVIIGLIGLLCSSVFGIFLSSQKTSANSITMNDVVAECNQEFSDKLQNLQDTNPHDDYVLEGSMASWKDVLLVYTVKQSNGVNQQDVMTINDSKKNTIKQIFWDMNELSSEVKTEMVTEQGINTNELPKQVEKKVLHIKISSKNVNDMKSKYSFNMTQNNQLAELSNDKYASLWNGVIYGSTDSGEYVSWRQGGSSWSNIKIGDTNSTIGNIGCLVTSVAILIEKSGVNTQINPFNPGTFVEALNKNGGFDGNGNLQYAAITKVVSQFKFVGKIDLKGKSKTEKLALITQYFNNGYYITAEVKGATPGNQHWVAITGINGNNINMVDPGSNQTDMWSAYEFSKTSQFNYFKAN